MSGRLIALILTGLLTLLGLLPAAYVLLREAIRRVSQKVATKKLAEAEKLLAEGANMETVARDLEKRFDRLTIERAAEAFLMRAREEKRTVATRLFERLGLIGTYIDRVRTARRWADRTHAAQMLGELCHPSAIPALVETLRDPYEDEDSVKAAAAEALARFKDPESIPLFVEQLSHVDERSTPVVVDALVSLGEAAIPTLLDLLAHTENPAARIWAARILGKIGSGMAVDALIARLHDRHDLLRMAAAEALGAIGEGRTLQSLVQATLRDPAPTVRASAATALAKVGGASAVSVLVAALSDPDYGTRLRALEAFESIELEDTSALETALRDTNGEVRRRAALALERMGHLDRLVKRLTSDDFSLVERAYEGLLEMGRAGLVESIAAYVHHESFRVRVHALRAVSELGAVDVTATLLVAASDAEWPVRAQFAQTLGRLRPEKGPEMLAKLLVDAEEPVREAAAEAFSSFSAHDIDAFYGEIASAYDSGSVPVRLQMVQLAARIDRNDTLALLLRALSDPSAMVRLRATEAVGARATDRAVEELSARLTDDSLDVRLAAVTALGSVANARAFEALVSALSGAEPKARERIAESLSKNGRELLFERFSEFLGAPLDVKLGLAWALGKMGDGRSVPHLACFLEDADPRLRASAAGALGKISGDESKEALSRATEDRDPRVRAAVVNALGRHEGLSSRSERALRARLSDPDTFVRTRALYATARTKTPEAEELVLAAIPKALFPQEVLVLACTFVGTERAVVAAMDLLSQGDMLERTQALIRKEEPELRTLYYGALGLENPEAQAGDRTQVVLEYEQTLRTSPDARARRIAVEALSRIATERSLDVLVDTLVADPALLVRIRAAEVLSSRVSEESAKQALARALSDPEPDVVTIAATALSKVSDPKIATALYQRLGASSKAVARVIQKALSAMHEADPFPLFDLMMGVDRKEQVVGLLGVLEELKNPVALPLLQQFLRSREPEIRAAAVSATGKLPIAEARAAIDTLCEDPHEDVRLAIVEVVTECKDPSDVLRLAPLKSDPSERVRTRLAERLVDLSGGATLRMLEGLSEDGSPRVRAAALGSLLGMQDGAGLVRFVPLWGRATLDTRHELRQDRRAKTLSEHLGRILTASPTLAEREAAILGLAAVGASGYEAHVLPALRDPAPSVRIAAIRALASIDDDGVRTRIEKLLSDPDSSVREAAKKTALRTVG